MLLAPLNLIQYLKFITVHFTVQITPYHKPLLITFQNNFTDLFSVEEGPALEYSFLNIKTLIQMF